VAQTQNEPLTFPAAPSKIGFSMLPDQPPAGPREDDLTPEFLRMARAVASIAATRMLLLLAVVISAPIWIFTVVDPDPYRIAAAGAFSAVTVLPLVALYFKRG
jgi:hypothetical protein